MWTYPLKPRYINNELEEGRPVSSKSVYPRNSVWIANLDTERKHCTGLPGSPGIFVSGVVYLLCPNSLSKLKSGIDRFWLNRLPVVIVFRYLGSEYVFRFGEQLASIACISDTQRSKDAAISRLCILSEIHWNILRVSFPTPASLDKYAVRASASSSLMTSRTSSSQRMSLM